MDDIGFLVDFIEIIIFLLILLARPIGRWLRGNQQKQQEQAPAPPPTPQHQRVPEHLPTPHVPRPSPPVVTPIPDLTPAAGRTNPLAGKVRELQREADHLAVAAQRQPLDGIPEVAVLARWLTSRQADSAEAAIRALDLAQGEVERSPDPTTPLVDSVSEAQEHLRLAVAANQLEGLFANQRRAGQARLLRAFDRMIGASRSANDRRERWALLWDASPLTPPLLAGAGRIGVVPIRGADARSATGTAYLARGMGFDLLGTAPTLADEVRDAAMAGPLAGARWSPGFPADERFDAVQAFAAWAPHLFADLVGAELLGFRYAKALVDVDVRAGLRPVDATSIVNRRGRYEEEPPLVVRLAAIDPVVQSSAKSDVSAVGYLEQRLDLPPFLQYVVSGGATRRLDRDALLGLVRTVGEALAGARVESLGGTQLGELFPSAFRSVTVDQVRRLSERLRAGESPENAPPLALWLAAIDGEVNAPVGAPSLLGPLVRALVPSLQVASGAQASGRPSASDRALIRQAYVLSEIL